MPVGYFFGVAFRHGRPIVKGASKKFQKLFEKEYGENRAAGLSTSSAHKEAASTINKQLKEFPKKVK
tara:strand:+ start:140 stop:340 length:201 start_codon:yes stop_codon:yes gene_type:complete